MPPLNRRGFLHALSLAPAALALPPLPALTRSGVTVPPEYLDRLPAIEVLEAELASLPPARIPTRRWEILNQLRALYSEFDPMAAGRYQDAIFADLPAEPYQLHLLAGWHDVEGRYEQALESLLGYSRKTLTLPHLSVAALCYMGRVREQLRPDGGSIWYAIAAIRVRDHMARVPSLAVFEPLISRHQYRANLYLDEGILPPPLDTSTCEFCPRGLLWRIRASAGRPL